MEIKTIVEKIRKSIHSHDFLFSFQNIIQGIWKIWRVCFLKTIYILDPVDDSTKSKYILSDYIYGEKKIIQIEEAKYEIQLFEGEHSGEYVVSETRDGRVDGRCQLFDHGVLSLAWNIRDGKRVGAITEYENGKVLYKRNWNSIVSDEEKRVVENSKDGLVLTITTKSESDGSDIEIYRGNFDVDMNRSGYGLEYDRKTGKEKVEGYWEKDKLIRIIREFDVKKGRMFEYTESENVKIWNRIPVYVGGYCLKNGSFVRNGKGCLIDEVSGAAIRESEWKEGKEKEGTDMFEGWYVKGMKESIRSVLKNERPGEMSCAPEEVLNIPEEKEVLNVTEEKIASRIPVMESIIPEEKKDVSVKKNVPPKTKKAPLVSKYFDDSMISAYMQQIKSVTNTIKIPEQPKVEEPPYPDFQSTLFQIPSKSYNATTELDFSKFANLLSIEINDYCFASVQVFKIDGLPQLKSLKIGRNSFTKASDPDSKDESKSFHVLNCESLESIEIGESSFCEFAGQFELANLPSLQSLHIGTVENDSNNFGFSSFVARGMSNA